jgi:hypothetical protein
MQKMADPDRQPCFFYYKELLPGRVRAPRRRADCYSRCSASPAGGDDCCAATLRSPPPRSVGRQGTVSAGRRRAVSGARSHRRRSRRWRSCRAWPGHLGGCCWPRCSFQRGTAADSLPELYTNQQHIHNK